MSQLKGGCEQLQSTVTHTVIQILQFEDRKRIWKENLWGRLGLSYFSHMPTGILGAKTLAFVRTRW